MRISLTDFVDVVARTGTRKATKVAQLHARQADPYHPCKDFYKPVRDAIVAVHKRGESKELVTERLAWAQGSKRELRQSLLAKNYLSWWGRKQLEWVGTPVSVYSGAGVSISINPELGVLINGELHVIKLYFKMDQLQRDSADLIVGLMEVALACEDSTKYAVLDVERRKLFTKSRPTRSDHAALIDAELAWISRFCGFDSWAA